MKVENRNWKVVLGSLVLSFALVFNSAYALNDFDVVRVGITDNKFQNVKRQEVTIYGTAESEICDKETKTSLARITPNTDIHIRNSNKGLVITIDKHTLTMQDVVFICPKGLLGVRGLMRKGKQALYHGALEVVQNENKDGFYLVNLVEIQDYLKGVVPNEMPVKFGLEALKAQDVAARNYVLTPRTQAYKEFNWLVKDTFLGVD